MTGKQHWSWIAWGEKPWQSGYNKPMGFIYAMLTVAGWVWLVVVAVYLLVRRKRLQRGDGSPAEPTAGSEGLS